MTFSKKDTDIAKGIAVIMLLWHHMFLNTDGYRCLFNVSGMPVETFAAYFFKSCVAVFLFLSGLGLYRSQTGREVPGKTTFFTSVKNALRDFYNRWLKLMVPFWVIFAVFVPLGNLFGRTFSGVYGGDGLKFTADLFGLSELFYGENSSFNATWWFMSAIIVLYILFPVIYKLMKIQPEILLVFSCLFVFCPPSLDVLKISAWQFPFVLGMYSAKYSILERMKKKFTFVQALIFCVPALAGLVYFRFEILDNSVIADAFIALVLVFFSYSVAGRIPVLNTVLGSLGKHSSKIFMFHTFVVTYYLKDAFVRMKYPALAFTAALAACWLISVILTFVMKITRTDKIPYLLSVKEKKQKV